MPKTFTKRHHFTSPAILAIDICELLFDNNANINAETESNKTPLHLASEKGHTDIIQLFITRGANINHVDRLMKSPLHYALYGGKKEAAEIYWLEELQRK